MRLAILSDVHTVDMFEKLYAYLKTFVPKYEIDGIVVNGDLLGLHNVKGEHDITKLFTQSAPYSSENVLKIYRKIKAGENIDNEKLREFSNFLKDFVDERYMWVLSALRKLNDIVPVFFNLGDHESPLHYKVIDELCYILTLDKKMLTQIMKSSADRDHFQTFKIKLKESGVKFLSQNAIMHEGVVFAGIPGLYHGEKEEYKRAQENIAGEVLQQVDKLKKDAKAILIFNHTPGIITKKPFMFEPDSEIVKHYLEKSIIGIPKLFCQSNHEFMTTHFYTKQNWYYLLNNAGVYGLFNVIDIKEKIHCYDVDANIDQVTGLTIYDVKDANYNEPVSRMSLNYANAPHIMQQRKLNNSVYNL